MPPPEGMAYNQLPDSRIGNLGLAAGLTCLADELYVWDRALSDEEIAAAYTRVKQGKAAWAENLHPRPPRSLSASNDLSLLKAAGRPPLPAAVAWDDSGAVRERTATRTRICLNGIWRCQPVTGPLTPPQPQRWLYSRVPGFWLNSPLFEIYDKEWKPLPRMAAQDGLSFVRLWDNTPLSDLQSSYIERDFEAPFEWSDKLILLQFRGLDYMLKHLVYINHQFVSEFSDDTTVTLDISKHVQPGQTNRILLYNHFNHALYRDVWLDVRAEKNVALEDFFFMPSVRQRALGLRVWMWNLSPEKRSFQIGLTVFPEGQPGDARSLPAQPVTLEPGEKGVRDVSFPWPDAHCWHPEDPFLYRGVVKLEAEGKLLDESYPERFGFREFWIRDGTFMLNETPFHIRMFSNDALWRSECGDAEWYRMAAAHFAGCKALHVNTQRLWARPMNEAPYILADEAGQLMAPFTGQPTRASAGLKDRARKEVAFRFMENYVQGKYRARSFLHEYKNHPSICFVFFDSGSENCWIRGANYAANLTEAFYQECLQRRPWIVEWHAFVDHVTGWFREVDPTRQAISYTSGLLGPARSCLSYYNFSQPMQEWQEQWSPASNENKRPLFNTEFSIAFPHMFYSQSVVENVKREPGYDTIVAEQCATYFGDRAYLQESPSFHRGLNRVWKGRRSFEVGGAMGSEEASAGYWELKRFFAMHLEQAYRYLRVNQGFHAEVGSAFLIEGETPGHRHFTLRSPGFLTDPGLAPDAVISPTLPAKATFRNHGQAWSPHTSPAYCFIGGSFKGDKADFSLKDHAFFSGETIEKAIYALNDLLQPLDAEIRWTLVEKDTARSANSGIVKISVPPGERREFNFSFESSAVTSKTRYVLRLEALNTSCPMPPDEFGLEVFPPDAPPKLGPVRIGLLDREGDTARLLDRAGVKYERVKDKASLEGLGLLIIGRKFLDAEGRAALLALEINFQVARGLPCLIFEQRPSPVGPLEKERDFSFYLADQSDRQESTILGFRGEDRRSRNVFLRAPRHPILEGLDNGDFANWRGSTDIEEPYPKPLPDIQDSHKGLKRFPRWSNKGIVSFYQVEKPQAGSFRCLLDCEYDLYLTPLLEFRVGQGTVLLNQLEVTNRYGTDPVATRLVHRMLAYMASRTPPPPSYPAAYFGHPNGRGTLDTIRLNCDAVDSLQNLAKYKVLIVSVGKLEKASAGPPFQQAPKVGEGVSDLGASSEAGVDRDAGDQDEEFEDFITEKSRPRPRPEAVPFLKALAAAKAPLEAFLANGGVLVVLPLLNESEAQWLPAKVAMSPSEFGLATVPENFELLSGIGVGDFFWRGWLSRIIPAGIGPPAFSTQPGLVTQIPHGKGQIVLLAFHPFEIPDNRAIAKICRIYSTLFFNLGVSSAVQPDLTVPGYNPGKFPYLLRTISFDPYDHGYY